MLQQKRGAIVDRRDGKWVAGMGMLPLFILTVFAEPSHCAQESLPPVAKEQVARPAIGTGKRWYTERQVAQGREIFIRHCAVCHGKDAAATPNWRRPDAAGNYPPPPLNGSAHTWHHPLPVLRETIQQGGAPLGGVMPGFAGKLSEQETDAVIAWFQSLWSDEIYQAWYRIAKDSL